MSKIPCRICPKCGMYFDISVNSCSKCGTELLCIPARIVETDDICCELKGLINENVKAFVKKCPACGTLNFIQNRDSIVDTCYKCHKKRIASIESFEYKIEDVQTPNDITETGTIEKTKSDNNIKKNALKIPEIVNSENEEMDMKTVNWLNELKRSIGSKIYSDDALISQKEVQLNATQTDNEEVLSNNNFERVDKKDEDVLDWGFLHNEDIDMKTIKTEQNKKRITLTAIRYGNFSFTIKAEDGKKYMLGRSAQQSSFLAKDGRVGNEHCYIEYTDGLWYVRDNHSANGTAVNYRDIGLDGESVLNDGDELVLGHHPDSMAFRISIN